MDKVFEEIKFNHYLGDCVDIFFAKYKQVEDSEYVRKQYRQDVVNLVNCNTIAELDDYVEKNKNKIYHDCVVACFESLSV